MKLTVITNIAAPYRDEVFSELQAHMDGEVFLLADDEPGRNWAGRGPRYAHRRAPALTFTRFGRPRYFALPTWLTRSGWLMVAGFGQPALATALFRPSSTLLWTEATDAADAPECGAFRTRLRAWLARRCRACVAVGVESARYCEELGARTIVMLPNVHEVREVGQAVRESPDARDLVLAHVGDWSYAKGADRTTEIVELLRARLRQAGATVQLIIAGHIVDLPPVAGSVYLGYLDSVDLWPALMAHDPRFLVLMSRRDRWGFVVSEAMAQGLVPIVTPAVGAAADLVRPLGPALIQESSEDAAEAILALHRDRIELDRLSAQARSLIGARTPRWAVQELVRGLTLLELGANAEEAA